MAGRPDGAQSRQASDTFGDDATLKVRPVPADIIAGIAERVSDASRFDMHLANISRSAGTQRSV